jgi:hypothetical protein
MLVLVIIGGAYDKYNDASEIIYLAFLRLFEGGHPYEGVYTLEWGADSFTQPLNYGPIIFLLYLPAMLFPQWYGNLWVGIAIMINFYCYLIAEYLTKKGSFDKGLQKFAQQNQSQNDPRENRFMVYAGYGFWCIPVGTTVITVFIFAPMFLCLLAFGERANPLKSGFFISMAGMCYQLTLLFFPVFAVYFFKQGWPKLWRFVLGCIPALMVLGIFIAWNPIATIDSLFLYTSRMAYNKCPHCENDFDHLSIFSVPRVVYNMSDGEVQIGNQSRAVLIVVLAVILAIYLFTDKFDKYPELYMNKYMMIATIGFQLTNNYGQFHYIIFIMMPLFYLIQIKMPDFRKHIPIGDKIWNYTEFNEYMKKYHKLPY